MRTQIRRTPRSSRRGFTLAEILIALALIALLAAVLLPTVAGQILKGDAGRVTQDLDALRTGIDQFLADVHRYPSKYSDLSSPISTAHVDINNNVYTAGLVSKWSGPYVTKDTLPGAVIATGFGGEVKNAFKRDTAANGVIFVSVVILGIAGPDFDKIDEQIDGPSATGRTAGNIRWATAPTGDSTIFRATPIQ